MMRRIIVMLSYCKPPLVVEIHISFFNFTARTAMQFSICIHLVSASKIVENLRLFLEAPTIERPK